MSAATRSTRQRLARTRRAAARILRHPGREAKREARRIVTRAARRARRSAARHLARMRKASRQRWVSTYRETLPGRPGVQRHKVQPPRPGQPASAARQPAAPRTTTPTSPTTTTSRPRPAGGKPTMSTSASTQSTARTGTPETEMIRRGISGVALWGPSRHAVEIHHRLSGLALVTTQFAAAQLAYAETLAGQGADPRRIVDPLTQIALAISSNGGDLVKLDRVFCNLYAGDLAQDDQPASRIRYAA